MSTSPNSVIPAERRESQRPIASVLSLLVRQVVPDAATNNAAETPGNIPELLFELGVEPTLTCS